jgi:hypothetical protein
VGTTPYVYVEESLVPTQSASRKCPRCGVRSVLTKSTYCKECSIQYEADRRSGKIAVGRTCVRCSAIYPRKRGSRLCDACMSEGVERTCTGCGSLFNARTGRERRCYDCRSSIARKYYTPEEAFKRRNRVFGLPLGSIEAMLVAQDGKCLSCDVSIEEYSHVDHDRSCCDFSPTMSRKACGKCVRGMLCRSCNVGIGHFGDDPDRLLAAAMYLLQSRNVLSLAAAER